MTEAVIPTPRRIARTPVVRQPSAATFIGQALSEIGQAGSQFEAQRRDTEERVKEIDHRIAMDEQKRQDDARYIEEAQRLLDIETRVTSRVAEARQQAGPFARGHDQTVRKILDEEYRAFDESLADNERVRQRLRLTIAQTAAQIDVREQGWQRQSAFKAQGEALETLVTTRGNQLARAEPGEVGQLFETYAAEVDAMIDAGAFNADEAAAMKRAARGQLATKLTEALFNAGEPQTVRALLDKGFFDRFDIDTTRLGDKIAAEQKALDIAAEQRQAEAVTAARAQADAVEAKVKLGINPSEEEFAAANAALAAAGVPEAERIAFGGLSVQIGLNRQYSEAADPDGIAAARAATALQGKIAAGTASEAEQVAYAHLSGVAEARAKAAGARRQDLAKSGVQGQLQVLADLDQMAPDQRFAAANEAMDGLGYVAQLQPHTRQYALSGREARKARPADFGENADVREEFSTITGPLAAMLGGSYDDVMNLAWDIYAGELTSKGRAGWDPALFGASVNIAFGSSRRPDGKRQGGLGDFNGTVILPSFQTADEFDRMVRRLTFGAAVYADGRPAAKADVLENYRPEYTRDAPDGAPIYRMIDESGRPLMKQGGGFYDFVAPRPARGSR